MSLKLKYFDVGGYAESIRYILHYTGKKFEDVRYEYSKWPIAEVKENLPFGKIPVLEENGKILDQSIAIARYVAAGTELLPSDPWQQAVLDATILTLYDFHKEMYPYYGEKDPIKKEEIKNKFLEVHCEFFLSRFEKKLEANNGYFGGKLSWADFAFVALIEMINLYLNTNIEQKYPRLKALMQKIPSLPGVKEYIASRKPYPAVFNSNNN